MNIADASPTAPRVGPAKVLAAAANGSVNLFHKYGGDSDQIFGRAGLRINDISSPLEELNLQKFCNLFEEAAQSTGNSNIGLEFGQNFTPKKLGMLGFAAISAPTLAAALRTLEKYFPAHQDQTSFGLIADRDILWLSYHILDPRIVNRRQDAELSLGVFCNIFKHALGPNWRPLEIRFEHNKPDGHDEHEMRFDAPIQFGRRTNAIAFRRSDLDTLMPEQDPYLASVVEPFLQGRCDSQANPQDFAMTVRNEVKMHLGESLPSVADISKLFGVSEPAFQKQLRAHGLNFSDVVKAARHELALHYIADPNLPLTEIAYLLGYSELSAFSRAFRNWTGMSPQRYRRQS
ncbi:MAG: AraC-like DNA-binding protein [Paracoccaceae bacterium]|jgi:AraC-like DNA-binding protein